MATIPSNNPQDQAELNRLYEKYIELLQRANKYSAQQARSMADTAKQAGTLNIEVERLEEYMNDLISSSDYLFKSFRETTGELKSQNILLRAGQSTFKNLTSIAEDLKYYHQGITDLSEKELKKRQQNLDKSRDQLDNIVKQLGNERGIFRQLEELERLRGIALNDDAALNASQKARLKTLEKEKELFDSAIDAQKEGLPLLQRELNISKQIAQTRENVGGIVKAAGGLISKFGGSLASFLDISDATEAVEEYNKKLVQGALLNKKVQSELADIAIERLRIEEDGTLSIEEKRRRILALEEKEDKIKRDAIKSTDTLGNKFKSLGVFVQKLGPGLKKALTDPITIITFFITKALQANKQAVELGKSLGYGTTNANAFRERLVDIERSSNNININTANLVEAFSQLTEATGFAYEFTADQLQTQVVLTKQVGLQAKDAAQIQRLGVLNNKTSEETYKSFVRGLAATRNQLKVGIDFKAALAEAVNVSGQLAANLGYNPERIAKAVVTAKALGMTLEQTAKAGESLLNFESSIENELKAELLTGKQLNLERARAAALQGDQITLAEELAKNVGTAKDFARMNVLQQKALAESMGMTTDELAETLRKREEAIASGKSLKQVTEEEAKKALERQSIQDKFNAAVEKLQSLFGNLMAGPLGAFIDTLAGALNIVNKIGNALSFLATPLKVIASIWLGIKTAQLLILRGKVAEQALTARQMVLEEGKFSLSKLNYLLQGESLRVKIATYLTSLREIAAERGRIILQRIGNLLGKQGLLTSIGNAVMNATSAIFKSPAGFLGPLAVPLALAAGAAVGALGYKFLKGDDVVSDGYGKRTLLTPEGSIALNNKDTVIAGTNLFKGDDVISASKGSIQVNSNTETNGLLKQLIGATQSVANKTSVINMDGKKVGTTLVQNSYKLA